MQKFRTNEQVNYGLATATLVNMRPLFHPSIEEITVEGILHALADPVRVAMFADLVAQTCPRSCSNFLTVGDKAIPKSTLSLHFKVLREAGLIRSERHGVEMHNVSRYAEVEQRFPGLVQSIVGAYAVQVGGLRRAAVTGAKGAGQRVAAK